MTPRVITFTCILDSRVRSGDLSSLSNTEIEDVTSAISVRGLADTLFNAEQSIEPYISVLESLKMPKFDIQSVKTSNDTFKSAQIGYSSPPNIVLALGGTKLATGVIQSINIQQMKFNAIMHCTYAEAEIRFLVKTDNYVEVTNDIIRVLDTYLNLGRSASSLLSNILGV